MQTKPLYTILQLTALILSTVLKLNTDILMNIIQISYIPTISVQCVWIAILFIAVKIGY